METHSVENNGEQHVLSHIERAATLGTYLRQTGSLMLVFSAIAFLLQKWGVIGHIDRYFSFLGFTGVMVGAALLCGLGVKEGKGARTLFALVAALAPVHFAQLGGLLFSVLGEVPVGVSYPQYFYWQAESTKAVMVTVLAVITCLTPLLFLAFCTLDRSVAKYLTMGALLVNITLLAPTRSPDLIAALAIAGFMGVGFFLYQIRDGVKFNTFESRFARGTLYLPPMLILGRQVTLYGPSEALISSCLFLVAGFLFLVVPRIGNEKFAGASQIISSFPLLLGWCIALETFQVRDTVYLALLFGVPTAIVLLVMSMFSKHAHQALQVMAALVALPTTIITFEMAPSMLTSGASLITVLCFIMLAVILENKIVLALSCLAGLLTGLYHVRILTEVIDFNLWVTLGAGGMITIVAASLLEKHFSGVMNYVTALRKAIAKW